MLLIICSFSNIFGNNIHVDHGKVYLLLHLIAATSVVAQSEEKKECPFTKPLKCSLDDSFFKLSFAMVANPQQQLAYSRKGSGSLPLKMKLNLAAFNERCDKFQYHFNGAKFQTINGHFTKSRLQSYKNDQVHECTY